MALPFQRGELVELLGSAAVGEEFRQLLRFGKDDPAFRAHRNLAELGVGTDPDAHPPDNVLEAGKIKGSVHIGIGDDIHRDGLVESDLHEDSALPQPDLILDARPVIGGGEWRIQQDPGASGSPIMNTLGLWTVDQTGGNATS